MHAYNLARQAVKHDFRRRDRGEYDSMNVNLPAEERDHRRQHVGTKVYRAPNCFFEENVNRGTIPWVSEELRNRGT